MVNPPDRRSAATDRPAVVVAEGLSKTYKRNAERVHALREVGLALHPGELVALVGPSGSGKSTLLNVLCGWERPDAGALSFGGALSGRSADGLGWAELALIPQSLGLLDDLTIAENITLPARLAGSLAVGRVRATELMTAFGIDQLASRYPQEASLGEQQRCCVARAVLLQPRIVLADEPTSHQDARWTEVVFGAFRRLTRAGSAALIATHNPETWPYADRLVSMHDGQLHDGAPAPIA